MDSVLNAQYRHCNLETQSFNVFHADSVSVILWKQKEIMLFCIHGKTGKP